MTSDEPRGRPPWRLDDQEDRFVIKDADGRPLYFIPFYRKGVPVPNPMDLMSWDEALKLARAMRELPELRKLKREKPPE